MKSMPDMHQRMRSAKTAAERQALMADPMKAMHDGMAKRHQMMTDHMPPMQMMMDMMSDRMAPASVMK